MDLQDERLLVPGTLGEALQLDGLEKFVVAASAEDRALFQFLGVHAASHTEFLKCANPSVCEPILHMQAFSLTLPTCMSIYQVRWTARVYAVPYQAPPRFPMLLYCNFWRTLASAQRS